MEPKNFLFISLDNLIGDIAWQLIKEGHNVKYYVENEKEREVASGFIPIIDSWESEVDWADVIIFDDVLGQGTKAKMLRDKGKAVIGGTPYTDKLEDDRAFGQEELKNHGVKILPYREFTSFDEAIEFVKQNPHRYVIKPSGEAQNVKSMLFIGEEEDGRDVLQVLEDYKNAWAHKIPDFQLQKRIFGVEVAVGAFFNGKEFIYPININFEHKKLFPGNLGPSTGEMGCYQEGTKVLTRKGWKDFREILYEDELATLNPDNLDIEYQRPTNIVKYNHHKKLIKIKNRTLDIGVTLDHNMVGIEANKYRKGDRKLTFTKAKDLPNQFVIFRSSEYKGNRKEFFVLPSIIEYHREGKIVKGKVIKEKVINMDDWLKFLGLWLAEGCTTKKNYCVGIAQSKTKIKDLIKEIISNLPFNFKERNNIFYCYNKQLWSYLSPLGDALTKYIPRDYMEFSKEQLEILYNHMFLGDGNQSRKTRVYYTSSKRLAEDVQEIFLKINKVGIIKERNRKNGRIGDREFKKVNPSYEVMERNEKKVSWIDKRDTSIISYEGYVYCVEVPNHVLYVKYNEKPFWCGNTSMFWSGPNKIFNQTLKKFEETLAKEQYVGYIDINCIVNGNGIYPLEWTSRFGYPTINIQQEGMLTPISEFLYELAKGNKIELKTKSGFQIGVRVVVPPFPFEDKETFDVKSKDSVVYFKNTKNPTEGLHIEDVKLVNGKWLVTGERGVVLIVCGTGSTMKQAQNQVYTRIRNINIPHMYYRDDIGDRWYEDSDKLHNWGYLREA
ncbi:MAG: phosphoribosylglycinamide synthetase C domain-containing protein [archaeon]